MITARQMLIYDLLWDKMFNELLKYRKLYETVIVPNRADKLEYPEWERKLGSWVATQRQKYKNEELLQWRYEKLISVDFEFEPNNSNFELHFADFLKYKEKYGHGLVPQDCNEYPSLGKWVSHIRTRKVPEERRMRLDEAGFIWNHISEIWQIRFRELCEFKKKYGHMSVSEKKPEQKELGTWCTRMRKAKRHGKGQRLSEIQISLLDSINFNWEPEQTIWDNNFSNLLKFKDEFGHCLVPIKRCKIEGLGWWVYWLRKNKHKVSNERIKALDELGFEWNADIAYRKRNNIKGINNTK